MHEENPGEYGSTIWRNDFLRKHPFIDAYLDGNKPRETLISIGKLRQRAVQLAGTDFARKNVSNSPFLMATRLFGNSELSHSKLDVLEHHLETLVLVGLECGTDAREFNFHLLEQINM